MNHSLPSKDLHGVSEHFVTAENGRNLLATKRKFLGRQFFGLT
jgi:hypothetical protein